MEVKASPIPVGLAPIPNLRKDKPDVPALSGMLAPKAAELNKITRTMLQTNLSNEIFFILRLIRKFGSRRSYGSVSWTSTCENAT
jgi:hypothetical protein